MKKGTHVIIQARMGSSRLPGKILAPFIGEFSPLHWIVERAKMSKQVERVIVATSTNPLDEATEAACKMIGCDVYRGSEEDVLTRFYEAVKLFDTQVIADATGDNPFFDLAVMDRMIEMLEGEHYDYLNSHPGGLPTGTGTQVFTRRAFDRVAAEADTPYDHEHVTPYFYHHPELFKQKNVAPAVLHPFAPAARLTLDTSEDLQLLQTLAKGMGFSKPSEQPTTNEILTYLQAHPEVASINKEIVQKTFPKA